MKAGETEAPYDNEQTVWHAMFDDLDNAITILKSAATFGVNQDLAVVDQFYKGDCSKWLKFANTLKLRMAIRISGVEPEYAQTKAQEAVLGGVMEVWATVLMIRLMAESMKMDMLLSADGPK